MSCAVEPVSTMKKECQTNSPDSHGPSLRDVVMIDLYDRAMHIANLPPRANVLILGETGAGKEVLAKSIHRLSKRADAPFVIVNCAAIAESLFERELFGHKKGAYTDAKTDAPGYFEKAHGGTILLDEIGELPRAMQPKLLRVVEERSVCRVGDPTPRPTDVRIIAATNRNLESCVAQGTFRSDLYHRLNAIEVEIPPLRMRPTDILPLAEYLLDDERRGFGLSTAFRLSREAIECLLRYEYPGNVRELRYALSSAILQCRDDLIRPEHLPRRMTTRVIASSVRETMDRRSIRREAEFERIRWALVETGGNQTRAARLIDMPLRTFVSRLDALGIPRPKKNVLHTRRPGA